MLHSRPNPDVRLVCLLPYHVYKDFLTYVNLEIVPIMLCFQFRFSITVSLLDGIIASFCDFPIEDCTSLLFEVRKIGYIRSVNCWPY